VREPPAAAAASLGRAKSLPVVNSLKEMLDRTHASASSRYSRRCTLEFERLQDDSEAALS